jgi:hypothetical protein
MHGVVEKSRGDEAVRRRRRDNGGSAWIKW